MKRPENSIPGLIHLGSVRVGHKGPGSYLGGVVKLHGSTEQDLLSSADCFLKAADRCLNGGKHDAGVETLIVPGAVCAAFSCELFLKYAAFRETGKVPTGHHLAKLFRAWSPELQAALSEMAPGIEAILDRNSTQFVSGRYHHEHDQFSFRQAELLQAAELLSVFARNRFHDGVA